MPGQIPIGQPPAQRQGECGPRRQNGGPIQKEIISPPLSQGAESRKDHGGRQHQREKSRLPHDRAVVPHGGGVKSGNGPPLLAGPLGRVRDQIGRLVVQRGGAERVVHSRSLSGTAPEGKRQRQTADGGVGHGLRPPVLRQTAGAVRRRHQGGQGNQQLTGAAAPGQQLHRFKKHMAAQQRRHGQAGQQHNGLPPGFAAPAGHGHAVPLQHQQQRRRQRDHCRRRQKSPAAVELRPAGRRLLKQLRLRSDGFRLRFRLRRTVELLRLLQGPAGEQPPPPGRQQGFRRLLHHGVHGAAHHILQRNRTGRLRQRHIQNVQLHRGDVLPVLLRRRIRRRGGGGLLSCRPGRRLRSGSACLRRGRAVLPRSGFCGRRLRLFQQCLLQAAAKLRQNLLQGVSLLRGRYARNIFHAVLFFFVLGVHSHPLFIQSAGEPPHTAESPRPRRRSENLACPAWEC